MLAMGDTERSSSKVLLDIDPSARDSKLLINKDLRSLDDIRKSFKQEQNASSVLNQVRSFLPMMASANDELQKRMTEDPDHSVDIEDIAEDAQHIEMNLALVDNIEGEDTTDSECSSDEDDVDVDCSELNENNIKLPKQTKTKCDGRSLVTCLDNDNLNTEQMDCTNNEKT